MEIYLKSLVSDYLVRAGGVKPIEEGVTQKICSEFFEETAEPGFDIEAVQQRVCEFMQLVEGATREYSFQVGWRYVIFGGIVGMIALAIVGEAILGPIGLEIGTVLGIPTGFWIGWQKGRTIWFQKRTTQLIEHFAPKIESLRGRYLTY